MISLHLWHVHSDNYLISRISASETSGTEKQYGITSPISLAEPKAKVCFNHASTLFNMSQILIFDIFVYLFIL